MRYRYENIEILKIYDADTITVKINLGFDISFTARFRLSRINAYEVRGKEKPKGLKARDWLRSEVGIIESLYENHLIIETEKAHKKGKYGRYLCELIWHMPDDTEINLNDRLVDLRYAKYQKY